MQQREYMGDRAEKLERFGEGPWIDEPDKVQFTDPVTGYPCLIVRGPVGALCGYVGVPANHKFFGKGYDDLNHIDIRVHGGLTFANKCNPNATEEHGICHVPDPGESDDVWWFGFDCAHLGDLSPQSEQLSKLHGWARFGGRQDTYRRIGYVKRHIAKLALQLKDIE